MQARNLLLALSALSITASVWSFDDATTPAGAGGILQGPAVKEDAAQGREGFGEGEMGKNGFREERGGPRPRVWFKVLQEIELTPEQDGKVRPIAQEFHKLRNAFEKEHGPELKEIEEAIRKAKENGRRDKELLQKAKQLRDKSPKPEPYMEKIWALLTPEQQEQMRTRLAAMEKDAPRDRDPNRPMTGEPPMTPAQPQGDMQGDDPAPAAPQPQKRRRLRDRDDEAALSGLDETAKRRVQFLREHKLAASRPSAAPPERSRFFGEDGTEPGMNDESSQ